jgi:hypothetical protein
MSQDFVPPAPGQPNWGYPGPSYQPGPAPERPGRTLGIVGFIFSFVGVLNIAGLIVCIVALRQSRRAHQKNGFALAGMIIAIAGILAFVAIIAFVVPTLIHAGQECARLGNGTHVVGNAVYTCTPTSFNVSTRP